MLVLADTTKFAPVEVVEDLRSPDEILDGSFPGVSVENFYFEQVGFEFVSFLVTENGKVMPIEASEAVKRLPVNEVLANRANRPTEPS
jgi:translation initiation factor 2B subunit (eIF-2B alpha/beta/delta family)